MYQHSVGFFSYTVLPQAFTDGPAFGTTLSSAPESQGSCSLGDVRAAELVPRPFQIRLGYGLGRYLSWKLGWETVVASQTETSMRHQLPRLSEKIFDKSIPTLPYLTLPYLY